MTDGPGAPDCAIDYPSHKVPILTWWRGLYDHVFVALHPFYRVPVAGGAPGGGVDRFEATDAWQRHPRDFSDDVMSRGEPVLWSEVRQAVAPEEPTDRVFRAIWLLSCCGGQERAGVELKSRIDAYCVRERLFWPEDDCMTSLLEPAIDRFLSALGASSVPAWDKWRWSSVDVPGTAFAADRLSIRIPRAASRTVVHALHLPDPGVLPA